MGRTLIGLFASLIFVSPGLASGQLTPAQEALLPKVKGLVTTVQSPSEFQVQRVRVITSAATQFFFLGPANAQPRPAPHDIAVGMYVVVFGTKDDVANLVTADMVKVRDEMGEAVSGLGVIDRVLAAGAEPVFRADGYVLRMDATTEVTFTGEISALNEVGTNIWVRYKGRRNDSGEILLSRADFLERRMKPPKRGPTVSLAQATVFPKGSMIDIDGSFRTDGTDPKRHKPQDEGGACGWYPVVLNPALQQRVQRIGSSVIPRYQRELPNEDPAKIPFRFYAVEEKDLRSELGCAIEGLVLVTGDAIARLQNDDQLAAVLADRVAANLQRLHGGAAQDLGLADPAEAAVWTLDAPFSAGERLLLRKTVFRSDENRLMQQRERMELNYMADAGYDPWQAPEAWRLLAPARLPKNLSKLKYPGRSEYELEILDFEYKRVANATPAPGTN